VAGAGTVVPSADTTNWEVAASAGSVTTVNGVAAVGGNVTLTGASLGLTGADVSAAVNSAGLSMQCAFERTFSVLFPAVAGKAVDLELGNISFSGFIEVTLGSTYADANAAGGIVKRFQIGVNPNNNIWNNTSQVVEAVGNTPLHFAIGELVWSAASSKYAIPIAHLASSSNPIYLRVRGVTSDGPAVKNALSMSVIYDRAALPVNAASFTGKADTATKLAAPVNINGVPFDGLTPITVADSTKLPLGGGTLTGPLTMAAGNSLITRPPGQVAAVTGLATAPLEVAELVLAGAGFAPAMHQITRVGGGYRQHLVWGAYRAGDTTWSGGAFIAMGGNDNNATENFLFAYGGDITHSSGKTFLHSGNVNTYIPTVPLGTAVISGSPAYVGFSGIDTSPYAKLVLEIQGISQSTSGSPTLQMMAGGSVDSGSNYVSLASTASSTTSTGISMAPQGLPGGQLLSATVEIMMPGSTSKRPVALRGSTQPGSGQYADITKVWQYLGNTAIEGIRIYPGGGGIFAGGTITLYGIKK
jgi:hypothetical protein